MEKKSRKSFGEIAASLAATAIKVGPPVAAAVISEKMFDHRIETFDPMYFQIEDFPGLKRERHVFTSNYNQKLVGYIYYRESIKKDALVVLAHGYGGGGQRTYMDCINNLCLNGFYVFAYDATGNDESEGEEIGGFPQGIIDLNHAIHYIGNEKHYRHLPIVLFGHSWGGYCVSNSLKDNPQVKAIVAISGFNNSSELIKIRGEGYGGNSADNIYPFLVAQEELKFGKYADYNALDSFAKSKQPVFIIHSGDDNVVPYLAGYKKYYEVYKYDPRFKFMLYENRGHGTVYYNDKAVAYTREFEKKWDKFNKEKHTEEEKRDFINQNIDRNYWSNRIDKQLFKEIVEFYREALK